MKRITLKFLKKQEACGEAVRLFSDKFGRSASMKVVFAELIYLEKLDWANWLIVRRMDYKQYVSYAVYAAEQVIGNFEKEFPDDKLPREAIEAAKKCIKSPSKKNKEAAWVAACSAARSMETSARAAEMAAAWAAAESEMKLKILNYGLKLLKVKFGMKKLNGEETENE